MKKENTKCRYNGLQPTDGSVAFAVAIIFSLILSMAVAFITDPNTQNIVYSIVLQIAFMSFTFFFAYRACKRDCPHLVKRVPDTLYSLGFKRETIYKNGVESWLFDNSKVLQEALDFYFYMRQKNR